jgi:tape measure domain-containing protein
MAVVSRISVELDGSPAERGLRRLEKQANLTQQKFGGLQRAATRIVTAFAGIQAAKFVFFKTAELETQTKSLKVLTGSLNDAQKIIKELQQFGAVTPFTSAELIETAKRLKAFGFETNKIVDVTKRLGDIAGATGADLGGIATAFGQIQAKGRLQGEELLQLQERGVDLQGTLRKEYGLTAEQFQKALSKGQIGADAVNFALEKLTNTGGKYADGAIAQSDTLNGKLSTLVDGIDTIARALGEVLAPALKDIFDLAIDTVNAINQALAAGSITDRQKQGFKVQAEEEVKRFAGAMPGGPFGAGEIVVRANGKTYQGPASSVVSQITNDLINKEVQRLAGDAGAGLPKSNVQTVRPELGGGTSGGTSGGTGAGSQSSQRLDMSKDLFDLNKRLLGQSDALTEAERLVLNFQIDKQKIAEANLLPREEEIALLEAAAGFEQKILDRRKDQQKLTDLANKKATEQAKKQQEDAQRRLEADPGYQMQQQLEKLLDTQNQVAFAATSMGNAFANAFGDVVTGAKTGQEALAGMLKSIAADFLGMAKKIIAQQLAMILYQSILKALGGPSFNSPAASPGGSAGVAGIGGNGFISPFAEGGVVNKPTNALIGEGGEPEYIIPESKMRESMSRYSRGSRGGGVIPDNRGGSASEDGGTAVAAAIDVRYTVERINSVDYVTADQFQNGMQSAAAQGAQRGEQNTLKRLQMSGSARKRVGL